MNRLALIFLKMRRYKEAESLFVELLHGQKMVLGPDDRATLWTMQMVAGVFNIQNRQDEGVAVTKV